MSPILVRPVREQLEHDRIIRTLAAKFKRRFETGMNPGNERNAAVGAGAAALYPDLVLHAQERGHRLKAVVEVETGESVNHLEALAQWIGLSKLKAAFHLYVPSSMVEVARRLCDDNQIVTSELWSYHTVGDEVRFTPVQRAREVASPPVKAAPPAKGSPAKASAPKASKPKAAAPRRAKPAPTRARAAKPARAKAAKPPARTSRRK